MEDWIWILLTLALSVLLFFLWKKGYFTKTDMDAITDAMESLAPLASQGEGLFHKIVLYATYAFHAAEQMMKIGEIQAQERKQVALDLVQTYAAVDNVDLSPEELKAADALLEANCDIKGHGTDVFAGTDLPVEDMDIPEAPAGAPFDE
ncbi:MAG: hypothetical protein GXY67_07805 [Clostridiales bacterium]|nr:hypothetical protein [Clostridiales bacterium]